MLKYYTMTTSSPVELHAASYSLSRDVEGFAKLDFFDPFTGDQLTPDTVPQSISSHRQLAEGLDYLARHGDSVTLSILGAAHGKGAEPDIHKLVSNFEDHDVVFLEGIGHKVKHRKLLWEASAGNRTTLSLEEIQENGAARSFALGALIGMRGKKPAFYADIPGDGDAYEQSLFGWNGVLDTLLAQMPTEPVEQIDSLKLAAGISATGTSILREWYIVANIGRRLSELHDTGYTSTNPLLMIGGLHAYTLPQKLAVAGAMSAFGQAVMSNEGEKPPFDVPFDVIKAIADCTITGRF